MNDDNALKFLSTPGAVALALIWMNTRLKSLEQRMDLLAVHVGAPRPAKKSRIKSALLLGFAVFTIAFFNGCAHVTVTKEGFTALTPAWPWQDSTRVIDRLNVSSKTNSFTASVRGLNESETTSTNAVDMARAIAEGATAGAMKAVVPK